MTDMMKRYEAETDEIATWHWHDKEFVTDDYIAWLEAKAAAYDRMMSGGKKTLKEWANIFGTPVAVDKNFGGIVFDEMPELLRTVEAWRAPHGYVGKIPSVLIDYTDSWQDSLTLPDGWEEERMIAEHEHGMNMYDANGMP